MELKMFECIRSHITIPSDIWDLPNLTIQLLRFYEKIYQSVCFPKGCFLSNEILKEYSGMSSDSSISEAFKYFEASGKIKRVIDNGRRYLILVRDNKIDDCVCVGMNLPEGICDEGR
jgi:hypothetical protein